MTSWTEDEFAAFVAREHDGLELKSGASGKKLQEAMVAFSNTSGGLLLIGVDDSRTVLGRRRDQGTDDAIHEAALNAVNVGRYTITEGLVGDKPIVVVKVEPRADEVAQTSDGRVLRRQGGRNVPIFGSDLWELVSRRALRRFEESSSGVALDEVSLVIAAEVAEAHGWSEVSSKERWAERGLLHADGALTIAGVLSLTNPRRTLGAAKFVIDVRSYESDDSTSYVRREVIDGPVQLQAERATEWVLRDIGTELVVTGARRHDVPRLPRRAVREVIANAVAHRDYAQDRTPVVVEIRPSSVAVTSPGLLPPPVTVATLRDAQSARNHTVIDVLRRFGIAEDSGQGIDVVEDDMRLEMLHEPRFEELETAFRVVLPLRGLVSTTERAWLAEYDRQGQLVPGDRLLLLAVLRDSSITNGRAREVLGIDSVEARSRLGRLRDVGLLLQHGTRGRAYYTLGVIGPDRGVEALVLDAARNRDLTNALVRDITLLDRYHAGQLLKRLVGEGRLVQHGERRGTTYRLADSAKRD